MDKELDQNHRYFQQTRVAKPDIYRWPANGKPLEEQATSDVERYIGNGRWQNFQRNRLLDEMMKGWFDDVQDEVTREQALALMAKRFNE